MRLRLILAAGLALAMPVGGVAHAAQAQLQPQPQQQGIEFPFPERLGAFVLVRTTQGPGTVGARYERPGAPRGSGGVDVFATPTNVPPEAELFGVEEILPRIYTNVSRLRDLRAPANAPGAMGRLWRADLVGNPVYTGVMIGWSGRFQIKVRGTSPAAEGEAGWARVDALIAAFPWTTAPASAAAPVT